MLAQHGGAVGALFWASSFSSSIIYCEATARCPSSLSGRDISGFIGEMGTQLLFFDTFSHDAVEELNLDLVQFPSPVVVEEVRVIPLGARVQANFPGGVRLGATNPTRFDLEFFVNDLSSPGASTFETLGVLPYDHNGAIRLDISSKKIPTDGLLLRGFYNAITLAVYGTLSKATAEQLAATNAADKSQPVPTSAGGAELVKVGGNPDESPSNGVNKSLGDEWQRAISNTAAGQNSYVASWAAAATLQRVPPSTIGNWNEPAYSGSSDATGTSDAGGSDRRSVRHHREDRRSGDRGYNWPHNGQSRDNSVDRIRRSHERSRSPRTSELGEGLRRSRTPTSRSPSSRLLSPQGRSSSPMISNGHERKSQAAQRTETPPADDILSDISEGDIPDVPMKDEDSAMTSDPVVVEEPAVQGEDVEEVSDEEAEWSDDGDCMNPLDFDIDFGEDWVDPIKVFDVFNARTLTERLQHFSLDQKTDDVDNIDGLLQSIGEKNSEDPSLEWIEMVEELCGKLHRLNLQNAGLLNDILKVGLSIEKAMRQPKPPCKVRHLKSSLKLVLKATSCGFIADQSVFDQLSHILDSPHTASSLKVIVIKVYDALVDTDSVDRIKGVFPRLISKLASKESTRVKTSIASLIKKIHFNETLERLDSDDSSELAFSLSEVLDQVDEFDASHFKLMKRQQTLKQLCAILNQGKLQSSKIRQILDRLLDHSVGLLFIAGEEASILNDLMSIVLQQQLMLDGEQEPNSNGLGYRLVHCVHAYHLLDKLYVLCRDVEDRGYLEQLEILETLQSMFALTFSVAGRLALVQVLSISSNLEVVIRLAQHSKAGEDEGKKDMKKSGIRAYACELLLLVVRTSENLDYMVHLRGPLLALGRQDEASKLHELISWISPLEDGSLNEAAIPALCQIVQKNVDKVSPMSHELVTAVRALRTLCLTKNKRSVMISLFTNELVDHYLQILTKLCGYHEQPHLHTATFVGHNGYILLSVVKPVVETLKDIVEFLVSCLDANFKDVSMIKVLLRTYTLCTVVPPTSACSSFSKRVCKDVVSILMSFTSTSFQLDSNNSLRASVWQQMVAEVLVFVQSSPHTFVAGLRILSELLPLPLPIQSEKPLTQDEQQRAENMRNLWSAHLFNSESQIRDIIVRFGACSLTSVSQLLRNLCVQMADLSPPIATLVVKAIVDGIRQGPEDSLYASRLIILLSWAIATPSCRGALLNLVVENREYQDFFKQVANILSKSRKEHCGSAVQEAVIGLFQSTLDHDIAFQRKDGKSSRGPLPSKNVYLTCVQTLVDHLSHENGSKFLALRTLLLCSYHDFGVHALKRTLNQSHSFRTFMQKFVKSLTFNQENLTVLAALVQVLRLIYGLEPLPERKVNFEDGVTVLNNESILNDLIEKVKQFSDLSEEDADQVRSIQDELCKIADAVNTKKGEAQDEEEPPLEEPESLLNQYKSREVFVLIPEEELREQDEQCHSSYWLSAADPGADEDALDGENVATDLMEIAEKYLPSEFDINVHVRHVCDEKSLNQQEKKKKPKKSLLEAKALQNKNLISSFKAGGAVTVRTSRGFHRTSGQRLDAFRSRPANTSRPPSLHVDDFLLLQMRGQQPTGPTGYNKQSVKAAQELYAEREAKSKGALVGFREATKQPVFCEEDKFSVHSGRGGYTMRGMFRGRGGFHRGPRRGSWGSPPSRNDYGHDRRFLPSSKDDKSRHPRNMLR